MIGILIEKIGFLKDGLLDTDVYPLTFYRCVPFKHRQMYSFYRIMGRGRGEERWERNRSKSIV